MNQRMIILLSALAGLLALVALWSYQTMASARDGADVARADLVACRDIKARIEQLSRGPDVAAEREKKSGEVNSQVGRAAEAAGLDQSSVSRISSDPARRVGETAYKEQSTQVLLRRVSLEQFVKLTYNLVAGDSGLYAKSMRLSAPRLEGEDKWTAELILGYLIYDPPQTQR